MIEMYAIIAFALIAGGAALGIVAVVTLGIRREEKYKSFTADTPGRAAGAARAANGFYTRITPGVGHQASHRREELPALAGQRR